MKVHPIAFQPRHTLAGLRKCLMSFRPDEQHPFAKTLAGGVSIAMTVFGCCCSAAADPVIPAEDPSDIPVRTDPLLHENAVDLSSRVKVWINPDLPADEKPELIWLRAVWGNEEKNFYSNWEVKKQWGNEPHWYFTWPGLARFKGKTIVGFQENNRPHTYGDTVQHIIVSENDGQTWRSVAHYECTATSKKPDGSTGGTCGFAHGYFCPTSDGRLCMTGRHGYGAWKAICYSEDGQSWTDLEKWLKPNGQLLAGFNTEIFRPAWHDGVLYGLTRGGFPVKSQDGIHFDRIKVIEPADGKVCGNESASAFVGDRWIGFMRDGRISASRPPYTHWDVNTANANGGPHAYGGPNIKALPGGHVLTGSRGNIISRNNAVIFRYDGKRLTPMVACSSGATATGYPSFAWDDGHLWMAFVSFNYDGKGQAYKRGLITVAKFKWPNRT